MDGRVAVRICDRSKGIDEGNEVRAGSEALNVIGHHLGRKLKREEGGVAPQ